MSVAFDAAMAADRLRERLGPVPSVVIVLGSGLGALEQGIQDPTVIPFRDIPGFPAPTVEGHAGRYVAGRLGGAEVLLQCGRFHLYEGHPPELVAAPVRLAAALGVQVVVLTNAAGGIRPSLEPGDLVLLTDHINLQSSSPLVGPVGAGEARFPDMSGAYDAELRHLALEVARDSGEALHEGVYAAMLGPQYETPAEVRMLAHLGADVVGMSTVPEVLAARARGMRVLGVSSITNWGAGLSGQSLAHDEVLAAGQVLAGSLETLIRGVLSGI